MIKIIGSIDNAAIHNNIYYLTFADREIYQFLTMDSKERRKDLFQTQMANPDRMIPVEGTISNYNVTQEEVAELVDENLARGKEIEKNLETRLKETNPSYKIIPYSDVKDVELSNGDALALPHLLLQTNDEKIKYHLISGNFRGRGKLPDETFSKYENILMQAFGTLLKVKK